MSEMSRYKFLWTHWSAPELILLGLLVFNLAVSALAFGVGESVLEAVKLPPAPQHHETTNVP